MSRASRDIDLPLSFAQQRLWFLDQIEAGTVAYNMVFAQRLEGQLDVPVLERSLNYVVERHEALRTTFPAVGGKATQRIAPRMHLKLEHQDLSSASNAVQEAQKEADKYANEPFNLSEGPLVRAKLLQLAAEEHWLLLAMHHIVSDGWSMGILLRELATAYEAYLSNVEPNLPELPIQYADFAVWQRQWLSDENLEPHLNYWRRQLANVPSLQLHIARKQGSSVTTYRGETVTFSLDERLSRSIKDVSRQQGATPFMSLLTCWQIVLSRYSGQEDIAVGTAIANRPTPETRGVIGLFVNTLVLRTDLRGNPSFSSLLERVRNVTLQAYQHQDVPFERLVDELHLERTLAVSPLFQTMLVLQNIEGREIHLPSVAMSRIPLSTHFTKFDLLLSLLDDGRLLKGELSYAADLFAQESIDQIVELFERVIRSFIENPDQRVHDIALLTKSDEQQLLSAWNQTSREYSTGRCLHEFFEMQASQIPDAVAVVFRDSQITYHELDHRANQLAHYLRNRGVGLETRVGVCLERSAEMVVALLGVLKAGAAYVPLDPEGPPQRLSYMVEDAGVNVVITQSRHVAELPSETKVVAVDEDWRDVSSASTSRMGSGAGPNNSAYLIYTSGSTGHPKGALNVHAGICNRLLWMQEAYKLTNADRVLQKTPVTFDVSVWEFFWPLLAGGRLVIAEPGGHRDPDYLLDTVEREGITTLHFVPSMLAAFLNHVERGRCRTVRRVISSGEALPNWLTERFFELFEETELHNLYGPTEASVDVTYWQCEKLYKDESIPIGRPIANTNIYVLDAYGQPTPVGVIGELCIGGIGLARGYWNRPGLTAEKFVPDAFSGRSGARLYRTGDLARWTAEGLLEYVGRIDQQIKIRGFRVELSEIESVLGNCPGVRDCAVIASEQDGTNKRLYAYVARSDSQVDADALAAYARRHLPEYMIPSGFIFLDRLPLTANGKIDRKALLAFEGTAVRSGRPAYQAPRNSTEEILCDIVADLLKLDRVGIHDNFFEIGGDSILSIQLAASARSVGLSLRPKQVFEQRNIAELAASLSASGPADLKAEQEPVTGAIPLTPIQNRFFYTWQLAKPDHFNQAVLLRLRDDIDSYLLETATLELFNHHDALRMWYETREGIWRQWGAERLRQIPYIRHDFKGMPADTRNQQLQQIIAEVQGGLDPQKGVLGRAVEFNLGDAGRRLLLVIHHLAVDAVSWRILLDDLERGYRQLKAGESISLGPKTTSYREWAEELYRLADTENVKSELRYWQNTQRTAATPLPRDFEVNEDSQNLVGTQETITVELAKQTTNDLLQELPVAYHADIVEVLLTALMKVCCDWTGSDSIQVDVEGHGREESSRNIDLSRTVGWFTTIYPVLLVREGAWHPGRALQSIKKQLRKIPNKGLHYNILRYLAAGDLSEQLQTHRRPDILFNYLGQLDQIFDSSHLFSPAIEGSGLGQAPQNQRPYAIDLSAAVFEQKLRLTWSFSRMLHRRETVQRLANNYQHFLEQIIAHCKEKGAQHYTASDFPLANLNDEEFEQCICTSRAENIEDVYALSPMQKGLLFHALYEAHPSIYFIQLACRLDGDLDVASFREAWKEVIGRHSVLRTAFLWENLREPVQIVFDQVTVPWHEEDWRDLSQEEQRRAWGRYLEEDRGKKFDFSHAPLLRLVLVRIEESAWYFAWSHHHLVLDGWSRQIVLEEVFASYNSLTKQENAVTPKRTPFREYIRWLKSRDEAAPEAFWRRKLKGFTEPTSLALDLKTGDPQASSPELEERRIFLGKHLTEQLEELARRRQITVTTVLAGVWSLLLSRFSNSLDITFGLTLSGRTAGVDGIESMVGLFINTLPLRVEIQPDQTVADYLTRLHEEQAELSEYESSSLIDVRRWSEIAPGPALVEYTLVVANYPTTSALTRFREAKLGITEVRSFDFGHFPLTLGVTPGEDLQLAFSFNNRFHEEHKQKLLRFVTVALERMTADEQLRLEEIWSLESSEAARLTALGQGRRPREEKSHATEWFDEQREERPDSIAVVSDSKSLSYGELSRRADLLAKHLLALGVAGEVVVGLLLDRGLDLLVAIAGVLKAGAAYLPLEITWPAERVSNVLEDARVTILLTQQSYARELSWPWGMIIVLDDVWSDIEQGESQSAYNAQSEGANLAYVIYTSGSTGRPKGVAVEHRQLCRYVEGVRQRFDLVRGNYGLVTTTSADLGYTMLYAALAAGGTLHIVPQDFAVDGRALSLYVRREQLDYVKMTPSHLEGVLASAGDSITWPNRLLILGGEAFSDALLEDALRANISCRIANHYGPSETTVGAVGWIVEASTHRRQGEPVRNRGELLSSSVPLGSVLGQADAYVLDSRGGMLPSGVAGELFIGGDGVARGYLNQPALTAERFVPDPFGRKAGARLYSTGDRVRWLQHGALQFIGRLDQQIKIKGYRVETGEIEAVLREHSLVSRCAVIAFQPLVGEGKSRGVMRLVAYLTARGDAPIDARALKEHLAKLLPEYMVPSQYVILKDWPLTSNGKLDKRALPAPDSGDLAASVDDLSPCTPTEEILGGIWAEVLGVKRVGKSEDFFSLGGNSLIATQVISRVRSALGVELPLRFVFDFPILRDLARQIDNLDKGITPPIVRGERTADLPLSYAQQRLWFIDQLEPGSAAYNVPLRARLRGALDKHAFCRTVNEIIRRHEVLRTSFVTHEGEPLQHIAPTLDLTVEEIDLRSMPDSEREIKAREMAQADAKAPFDLKRSPLLRVTLLQVDEEEHILLLTMHHIVSDGWSNAIVGREFSRLYEGYVNGEDAVIPELPIQYADFALWQRNWLRGEILEEQLTYWRKQLAELPPLELPTDYPRPAVRSNRTSVVTFTLEPELTTRLRALGRTEDVTVFMILVASFQLTLAAFSSQDDVVVGVAIANRNRIELEALIGFFVNTLVLRAKLDRQASFGTFLRQVRRTLLEAYRHQDVPFEKVVQEIAPERFLNQRLLFQTMLIYETALETSGLLPALEVEWQAQQDRPIRSDLDLYVSEAPDRLTGYLVYDVELFTAASVEGFVGHLTDVLEKITLGADLAVAELTTPRIPSLPEMTAGSQGTAPLSYHQERLWFIDRFETGTVYSSSPTYHSIPIILTISGDVDVDLLERSFTLLVNRHSALRTRILSDDRQTIQSSELELEPPFEVIEWDRDVELNKERTLNIALKIAAKPFALHKDPLVRASFVRNPGHVSAFIILIHHMIADRLSTELLMQELSDVYNMLSSGQQPCFPNATLQYPAFASWQRNLDENLFSQHLAYWKKKVGGERINLDLPTRRPRDPVQIFEPGVEMFSIPSETAVALCALASDHQVPMFDLLFSCFYSILHIYSGQNNFLVGISDRCRTRPEAENAIGPFANLLPIGGRPEGHPFTAYLSSQSLDIQMARHYREMPFDLLVQRLRLPNDMGRTALFDVLFDYQERSTEPLAFGEAYGRRFDCNLGYGKYDLNVLIERTNEGLSTKLIYNTQLYERRLVQQLARHLQTLMASIAADPSQDVSSIPLLDEGEEQQILRDWNATSAAYPSDKTIHELFEAQVVSTPDAISVKCGTTHLSFLGLNERANRLAHCLAYEGVTSDTLVGICLEKSIDMVTSILAVLKAGAGYLPMDPQYPSNRLEFMLNDGHISHVITHETIASRFESPSRVLIVIDREAKRIGGYSAQNPCIPVTPQQLAYCIYTSGSTGRPNGVLIEHKQVVRLIKNDRQYVRFTDQDIWTLFHSSSFDFSVWEIFGALLYGATLIIVPRELARDQWQFLDVLRDEQVTILNQTPGSFYHLAAEMPQHSLAGTSLRYVIFGGEALQPGLLAEFAARYPEVKLINMYGITETTVHVSIHEITPSDIDSNISNIGKPIPTTQVYVLNGHMRPVPIGVRGEMYVAGDGLARGYLNRSSLTARRFIPDSLSKTRGARLYKTGDIARYSPQGDLEYLGRSDHQVKVRGYRIETKEIEIALMKHAGVRWALVLLDQPEIGPKQLVAYVVRLDGTNMPGAEQLRTALTGKLPEYMVPSTYVFLEKVPLTPNGKVDRKALPKPSSSSAEEFCAPVGPTEEIVANIFSEVLKLDRVGANDNFFYLGGHSLLATQVISRIRKELHRELPLRALFEAPTVRGLAPHIAAVEMSHDLN